MMLVNLSSLNYFQISLTLRIKICLPSKLSFYFVHHAGNVLKVVIFNNIFFLANLVFSTLKRAILLLNEKRKLYFTKYYYIGLGYKIFIYNKFLFIWVGLTHYTLIQLPSTIKIFTKKRRMYIVSTNQYDLNRFIFLIRKVKKLDIYKGKGLLEVKTYKGFLKMKSGKKKQY